MPIEHEPYEPTTGIDTNPLWLYRAYLLTDLDQMISFKKWRSLMMIQVQMGGRNLWTQWGQLADDAVFLKWVLAVEDSRRP